MLSALRRVVAAGEASAQRGEQAVADLRELPVERYPHTVLAPRIWQLGDNVSAYDASYLALAEVLAEEGSASLVTADARFARAARRVSDVEVLLAA